MAKHLHCEKEIKSYIGRNKEHFLQVYLFRDRAIVKIRTRGRASVRPDVDVVITNMKMMDYVVSHGREIRDRRKAKNL